ncbi:hypothetical protein [Reyranella sp.]|uniref:hypothetical protein n=1 Tax=Reyranella sp. TaxID=1929291 RepID=UPI003783375C
MRSISDRVEVSVDFPDKAYMGAFGRESSFDVRVEPDEVLLRIVRTGDERREIAVHLHYYLLADILKELGRGLAGQDFLDDAHTTALRDGIAMLSRSLGRSGRPKRKPKKPPAP